MASVMEGQESGGTLCRSHEYGSQSYLKSSCMIVASSVGDGLFDIDAWDVGPLIRGRARTRRLKNVVSGTNRIRSRKHCHRSFALLLEQKSSSISFRIPGSFLFPKVVLVVVRHSCSCCRSTVPVSGVGRHI